MLFFIKFKILIRKYSNRFMNRKCCRDLLEKFYIQIKYLDRYILTIVGTINWIKYLNQSNFSGSSYHSVQLWIIKKCKVQKWDSSSRLQCGRTWTLLVWWGNGQSTMNILSYCVSYGTFKNNSWCRLSSQTLEIFSF